MLTLQETLRQADVTLPNLSNSLGLYTAATLANDTAQTSGALPIDPDGQVLTGYLKGTSSDADIERAQAIAGNAALRALASLASVAAEHTVLALHMRVFVAAEASFTKAHLVANGASQKLAMLPPHTREAINVAGLPLGALVEVTLSAVVATEKPLP